MLIATTKLLLSPLFTFNYYMLIVYLYPKNYRLKYFCKISQLKVIYCYIIISIFTKVLKIQQSKNIILINRQFFISPPSSVDRAQDFNLVVVSKSPKMVVSFLITLFNSYSRSFLLKKIRPPWGHLFL